MQTHVLSTARESIKCFVTETLLCIMDKLSTALNNC